MALSFVHYSCCDSQLPSDIVWFIPLQLHCLTAVIRYCLTYFLQLHCLTAVIRHVWYISCAATLPHSSLQLLFDIFPCSYIASQQSWDIVWHISLQLHCLTAVIRYCLIYSFAVTLPHSSCHILLGIFPNIFGIILFVLFSYWLRWEGPYDWHWTDIDLRPWINIYWKILTLWRVDHTINPNKSLDCVDGIPFSKQTLF